MTISGHFSDWEGFQSNYCKNPKFEIIQSKIQSVQR